MANQRNMQWNTAITRAPSSLALILQMLAVGPVAAQFPCPDPTWRAFHTALAGPNGSVVALATLPQGHLLAAGHFTTIGGVPASRIARWDGATWSALETGVGGTAYPAVLTLAVQPNGHIIAGGTFSTAGGMTASNIARWDGSAWSPLGAGTSGTVCAVTTLANGNLIAAGDFFTAGGLPVNGIARWDGTAWSALGDGLTGPSPLVYALAVLPNGDLIAGGRFTAAGGIPASHIARWNGTEWSGLGGGLNEDAYALITMPNGDLIAAGAFTAAGGIAANHVARWDGAAWTPLADGTDAFPVSLASLPNGDLLLSAYYFGGGTISRWNGAAWTTLAGLSNTPYVSAAAQAIAILPNGDLIAGGSFSNIGPAPVRSLARYTCAPLACPGEPFGITLDGWSNNTCPPGLLGVQWKPGRIDVVTGHCLPPGTVCGATSTYYQIHIPLPGLPAGTYDIHQTVMDCSTVVSQGVIRRVTVGEPACPCYTNCDASTTAPILNANDFTCFLNKYAAGDPYANCDSSTIAPVLNVNDFTCYLNRFAAGCN